MTNDKARPKRWRWLILVFLLAGAMAIVPAGAIALHVISQAVGRTTVATNADGTERTVYWRDYPGVAGVDPQEILQGPTPEEGYAAGQNMVSEIKAALSAELRIEWAQEKEQSGTRVFHEPVPNSFGAQSLLTVVNSPVSQSTSVPQAWGDKLRAIRIIGEVSARYGYSAPALDTFDLWSGEDRIRELGGPTPETQVIVSRGAGPGWAMAVVHIPGPVEGQGGRFEKRLRPADGSFWQPNTITLSYGANGLLQDADREEFKKRLEPFKGLTPPAPLES